MEDTLIAYCLDKSGSMNNVSDDIIGTTNSFVESQDPDKNPAIVKGLTNIGICTFSDYDKITWSGKYSFNPINEYQPLTLENYIPMGSTALYDAITATITECDRYIADHLDHNVKVIIVIQTDGEENDSREATSNSVRKLINVRTECGWSFTFLGANQDACLTAKNLGINTKSAIQYNSTQVGSRRVSLALSSAVTRSRSADPSQRDIGITYTPTERSSQNVNPYNGPRV